MMALWSTLKAHDDTKGQKFTTSLHRYTTWLCKNKVNRKNVTLNMGELSEDVLSTATSYFDEMDYLRSILTPYEFQLLRLKYIERHTLEEISSIVGKSRSVIFNNLKKTIDKVRTLSADSAN